MHKVSHTEKGKDVITNFPTFATASLYAKSVKGTVLPGGMDDSFTIVKLGSRSEEEAKRARERAAMLAERRGEARFEAGTQARLLGASTSQALDLAALAEDEAAEITSATLTTVDDGPVQNVCACGRACGSRFTACYSCRRYS